MVGAAGASSSSPNSGVAGQGCWRSRPRPNAEQMARKFIAGSNVAEAVEAVRDDARADGSRSPSTCSAKRPSPRPKPTTFRSSTSTCSHGLTREVNALAGGAAHRPRRPRPDPAGERVGEAVGAVQPVRPDRPRRHEPRRSASGCGRSCALREATGAFVNFDMEQYSLQGRDAAHLPRDPDRAGVPRLAARRHRHPGVPEGHRSRPAAAARLGEDDAAAPVWVRLVKGAYWDYETVIAAQNDWPVPVFTQKWQTDANFEKLTEFLLENDDWLRPAFGSHNIRSIAHALAVAERAEGAAAAVRVPDALRHGRRRSRTSLQSLGHRVRVYTPYGQLLPGMAYLVRRLLENTSNDSFLRQGFAEGVSEEVLLMNPTAGQRSPRARLPKVRNQTTVTRHRSLGSGPGRCRFQNEPLTDFAPRSEPRGDAGGPRSRCARSSAARTRSSSTTSRCRSARRSTAMNPSHKARARRPGRDGDRRSRPNAAVAAAEARSTAGATRRSRSAPSCSAGWRSSSASGGSSWPRGSSTRAASRGARPTPTSPRRSTSASTTRPKCCGSAHPQRRDVPGEENALLLRAARRGGRHRPVELPARHPLRHDGRGARHRQHRRS